MQFFARALALSILAVPNFVARPARAQNEIEIGGQEVVTLKRTVLGTSRPEFTSVTLAPGRGMEILQITAEFPGKGEVNVLASPGLAQMKQTLDAQDNANGNNSYHFGAAFLVPYPNRIRGKLTADGKTVQAWWKGHPLWLPANNAGKQPGGEPHAMHGLILKAKTDDVRVSSAFGGEKATGVIHAEDFGGHWLSKTDLVVTITLTATAVDAAVTAYNVGSDPERIAIGWHPYFNLPSADRTQVRLHMPGSEVAEVENYNNVFPTGKLLPVEGTKFDLRAADGKPLGNQFFDDNWSQLEWKNGAATVTVIDPAAHYGVEIQGLSPDIKTVQAYAPPTANFVAIEHQFDFADPFGSEWGTRDTGMVTLRPGQSTRWHVRLRVFVP